ncbi:MAG: hypothetical protein R3C05_23815 [Pirellulaceae bacterium]
MSVTGTTIDGNQANGTGADQGGGGVFNSSGVLNLNNVTLSNNIANSGNGSGGGGFNDQGTLNVRNSSVTDNNLCGLAYLRPSGTIENVVFSGNVGGAVCPLLGTSGDDVIVVTNSSITINADVLNYINSPFPITIESMAGEDRFDIRSTDVDNPLTVDAGDDNDVINISSDAPTNDGSLNGILGNINVIGGNDVPGPAFNASVTANGTTVSQSIDSGDSLFISDQSSAAANTYRLTDTTFQRTGAAATGLITYNTVEQISIETGSGNDTFDLVDTATDVFTSVTTGPGNDIVNISDTAGNGILNLSTNSGGDVVNVTTTGAASVSLLNTGDGNDDVNVTTTGNASGLGIQAGTGIDLANILDTGADTATLVALEDGNDIMNVRRLAGDGLDAGLVPAQLQVLGGGGNERMFHRRQERERSQGRRATETWTESLVTW